MTSYHCGPGVIPSIRPTPWANSPLPGRGDYSESPGVAGSYQVSPGYYLVPVPGPDRPGAPCGSGPSRDPCP